MVGQIPLLPGEGETLGWYAMRAFYNRVKPFQEVLSAEGVEVFVPPIPSLFFIRASERFVRELKRLYNDALMFYAEPGLPSPRAGEGQGDGDVLPRVQDARRVSEVLRRGFPVEVQGGPEGARDRRMYEGAEGYIQAYQEGPPAAGPDRGCGRRGHGLHTAVAAGAGRVNFRWENDVY